METIQLRKGREEAMNRKHPWVFSGALFNPSKDLIDGEHVLLEDFQGNVIGVGHYALASIAVRILSFSKTILDQDFYQNQLTKAKSLRHDILHLPSEETDCYRLIAGEGDNLAGLIIDIYGNHAVIQCHTAGMLRDLEIISNALDQVFDNKLETIFLKSIHIKGRGYESKFLKGKMTETIVKENGASFHVDWTEGQKTGFFLDQRENRSLLGKYAKGRKVLNTFCYTGGFSIYALRSEATLVHSIDSSAPAMEQVDKNVSLNSISSENHKSITGNAMEFLKEVEKDVYDLIILDPPAFAKNRNKSHNAVQAYKRLNATAMKKIESGGIIFTFSCSQVIDQALFENTIRAAAIESGREVTLLQHLNQAPDHTVNMFHQEGHYLKGVVLVVR